MRLSGLLFVGFALATLSAAQAQSIDRIEIFDAGIYQHETERLVEAPGEPMGVHAIVRDPKLIEATTCIPARRGVRFGIRYRIVGEPANMFVNVRTVLRYPAPGLRDPRSNKVYETTENLQLTTTGNAAGYWGYGFDEDWEAMHGAWVFEIWRNEKLMASQKFEVGPCFRGAGRQGEQPWRALG